MAVDTSFDLSQKLSLDQAKLVSRSRLNAIGSYEIVIDYRNIPSRLKEEALEWLEANRLSETDPVISQKTFDGTWRCVSIVFDEDRSIIRQEFRINASITDDEYVKTSEGVTAERSYYWRITNPEDVSLPATVNDGEVYTKTANDNGDGTYDVVVTKQIAQNFSNEDAPSAVSSQLYTEESIIYTSTSPLKFQSETGGTIADANVGQIKRIDNVPLEDGNFRVTVTTRTAVKVLYPSDYLSSTTNNGFMWHSDFSSSAGDANYGGLIVMGRNHTTTEFGAVCDNVDDYYVISVSASINEYGLVDFTIRGSI